MDAYVPELDGGGKAKGQIFHSCDVWIPRELFQHPESFLRFASVLSHDPRTEESIRLPLARVEKHHIVVARHFWNEADLESRLGVKENKIPQQYYTHSNAGTVDWCSDDISPRDASQHVAWEHFNNAKFGVLNLACGKGKTVLALKKIIQTNKPAIVIVNNSGLVDQWIDRAMEFVHLERDQIGIVQGKTAEWDKPLVIAMIHTLANRVNTLSMEARQRFGTVIFDEVHHLSASKFSLTAPLFYGSRFGLTATPTREDGLEDVYYAHVGGIFYSDLRGDQPAQVFFKRVPFSLSSRENINDRTGEFSAGKLYKALGNSKKRNELILENVRHALDKNRKILVLCHSKDHPETLLTEMVARDCMNMYTGGVVTGATQGSKRIEIIRESDVTFATFQVAKEGLDVAELDTLVFATPFKTWGAFQQGKGRIERLFSGKKEPLVIILDDIEIGPAHGMCKSLKKKIVANGIRFKIV